MGLRQGQTRLHSEFLAHSWVRPLAAPSLGFAYPKTGTWSPLCGWLWGFNRRATRACVPPDADWVGEAVPDPRGPPGVGS